MDGDAAGCRHHHQRPAVSSIQARTNTAGCVQPIRTGTHQASAVNA